MEVLNIGKHFTQTSRFGSVKGSMRSDIKVNLKRQVTVSYAM